MTIPVPTSPRTVSQPVMVNAAVAKSIARPDAFSKAGTVSKTSVGKGVRFRPLKYQRPPGRPRKHPRDKRDVIYY